MSKSESNGPAGKISRLRGALAWPGLYGWVGTAFAAAGLWLLPSGLVLHSKAASLKQQGPRAREAAEEARRLGFGEVGPAETVTAKGEKRWGAPFGFMAPSLRRQRGEHKESRPVYVVKEPLDGRTLELAREGAEANARSSVVFGIFCVAVACFWWGFRLLDPVSRRRSGSSAAKTQ